MKKFLLILMLVIPASLSGQTAAQKKTGTQERSGAQAGNPDRVTFNVASSLLSNPQNVNVPVEELPKAISDNVARERPGYTIKEAKWDWSTNLVPGNIFVYQVVVSNGSKDQIMLYNREGKFLKTGNSPSAK